MPHPLLSRRRFVCHTAVAATAAMLAPLLPAQSGPPALTGGGAGALDRLNDTLDDFQRRIALRALELPRRQPWVPADRAAILSATRDVLAFRRELVPSLRIDHVTTRQLEGYRVERLQATSWPGCRAAAYLYLPETPAQEPLPIVLLLCGHTKEGKDAPAYRSMARLLALAGSAVLMIDNLGQGERTPMGHWHVVGPFAAGYTLQGLIVSETIGWLNWVLNDPRFDPAQVAAIGNSGGGMLAMFLAALERERLAAVCSSGTLSSFEMIARKEARMCSCNVFPGAIGHVEMWELLSAFAPKPLFVFQGRDDEYFSNQLFATASRRILRTYAHRDAADRFASHIYAGNHPWNDERRLAMLEFLRPILRLRSLAESAPDQTAASPGPCYLRWPDDALTTDQLASQLSGKPVHAAKLSDVFPPPDIGEAGQIDVGGVPANEVLARCVASLSRR